MKMTKMNRTKTLRTLLSLLVLTAMLAFAFCLTVSADEGVQWRFANAEHTELSGDGVIYEKIELPVNCERFELADRYVYMNSVKDDDQVGSLVADVLAAEKGGYLVYLSFSGEKHEFYCRSDMLDEMQAYLKGEEGRYVIRMPNGDPTEFSYNDRFYDMSDAFAEELLSVSSSGVGSVYDVTALEGLELRELRLQDKSGLLTTLLGTVYKLPDSSYGFVDYKTLNNSHFDADGNFSYRQGEVTVYALSDDFDSMMKNGADGKKNYTMSGSYTYEHDEYEDEGIGIIGGMGYIDEDAITAFWVVFVMAGYLLPIAPLAVGLVFARSKKMSHPKRWYLVAGLAALWLLLSVILTVLLLL